MTRYIGTRVGGASAKLASSDAVVSLSGIAGIEGERTLTAGTGITITDGGAGSTVTLSQATTTLGAPYVTVGNDATLTGERAITAGTGISITDGGANSTVTISSTLVSGISYVCVSDESAKLAGMRQLTAGANITIGDSGAGGDIIISAAAGAGATITSQVAGTARPVGPSAGDILIWNNINYIEICSGTGWVPLDPCHILAYFVQTGKLNLETMSLDFGSMTTIPTPDDTSLPVGATFTISGNRGLVQMGVNAGGCIAGWDTKVSATQVLFVVGGIVNPFDSNGITRLGVQVTTPVASQTFDDAYTVTHRTSSNITVTKENAGASTLDTSDVPYRSVASTAGREFPLAIYYNGTTRVQEAYGRPCGAEWLLFSAAADADFSAVHTAFVYWYDPTANDEAVLLGPVFCFSST